MRSQKSSSIVRQSNKLVEARYSLTVNEQRVLLSLISMIHPKDKDFKSYELDIGQLAKLMDVNHKNAQRDVEDAIFRIQDRVIFIKKNDWNYLRTHWLSSVEKIGDKIQLSFDPKLKPYLLQLKEQFTQFQLSIIVQFKSTYTIRIYALLKQYESLKLRKFEVEQLRTILGIEKGKYSQFKEFKRWVLNQAKKEFEERNQKTGEYKSDITFDIEAKREGRFIKYLTFHIKPQRIILKKDGEPQPSLELAKEVEPVFEPPILKSEPPAVLTDEQTEVLCFLKENCVNSTTAKSLAKDFPPHRIVENIKLVREKHKNGTAKDLGAMTVTAIREDWSNQMAAFEAGNAKKRVHLPAKPVQLEPEAKQVNDLQRTFENERDEHIRQIINGWETITLEAEINKFIAQADSYTRRRYNEIGMESNAVQANFRCYVRNNYLALAEREFKEWAKAQGCQIEGNEAHGYKKPEMKPVGTLLSDVMPKIESRADKTYTSTTD